MAEANLPGILPFISSVGQDLAICSFLLEVTLVFLWGRKGRNHVVLFFPSVFSVFPVFSSLFYFLYSPTFSLHHSEAPLLRVYLSTHSLPAASRSRSLHVFGLRDLCRKFVT